MKPEVKELWVAALRNPSIKQGRGYLKEGDEYCCLGVLTELFRKSESNIKKLDWYQPSRLSVEGFDGTGVFLPKSVADWAGLTSVTRVKLDNEQSRKYRLKGEVSLEDLNDAGASFSEIADVIEKQL